MKLDEFICSDVPFRKTCVDSKFDQFPPFLLTFWAIFDRNEYCTAYAAPSVCTTTVSRRKGRADPKNIRKMGKSNQNCDRKSSKAVLDYCKRSVYQVWVISPKKIVKRVIVSHWLFVAPSIRWELLASIKRQIIEVSYESFQGSF